MSGSDKERKESSQKVTQMLKELDIKQKQLLKLIQNRDSTEAKKRLMLRKYEVAGKLSESLDLLILFTKECQEDAEEIRTKLRETMLELDDTDRKLRYQDSQLVTLRRENTDMNAQLQIVQRDYLRLNPQAAGSQDPEKVLDEEI